MQAVSEHCKTSLTRLVPSIAFIIAKWRPTRGELLTRPARSRDLGQGAEESSLGWELGEGVMRAQLTHLVGRLAV